MRKETGKEEKQNKTKEEKYERKQEIGDVLVFISTTTTTTTTTTNKQQQQKQKQKQQKNTPTHRDSLEVLFELCDFSGVW